MTVAVVPTRRGDWRVLLVDDLPRWKPKGTNPGLRTTPQRYAQYIARYCRWWQVYGHRLALSPEMWQENGIRIA